MLAGLGHALNVKQTTWDFAAPPGKFPIRWRRGSQKAKPASEVPVQWFAGNFQDYEADKCRRLGLEAIEPHRLRYRPITR